MTTPYHRHQISLEGVIDFSAVPSLNPQERQLALHIFDQFIKHYEPLQIQRGPYKRITLLRAAREYAPSEDGFLRKFFLHIGEMPCPSEQACVADFSRALSSFMDFDSMTDKQKDDIDRKMSDFADTVVNDLILPFRAAGGKTPQPSPGRTPMTPGSEPFGTPQRISTLRRDVLYRDGQRCVISHKFNRDEASKRFDEHGTDARDDDGGLLTNEDVFEFVDVCHIISHSIMSTTLVDGRLELAGPKKATLAMLDMFDPGVVAMIGGMGIDRPFNAITLTKHFHQLFGNLKVYFERAGDNPHTYKIDSTENEFLRDRLLPINRTLRLSPNHTIDPPSERLLLLHRSLARIAHISGAGEYADRVLRDFEASVIHEEGSYELGAMLALKFGILSDGVSVY